MKAKRSRHISKRMKPPLRDTLILYFDDEVNDDPATVDVTFHFGKRSTGAVLDVSFDGRKLGREPAQSLHELFNHITPPPYPTSDPPLTGSILHACLFAGTQQVGLVDIVLQDDVDVSFNSRRLGRKAANILFDVFKSALERALVQRIAHAQ
jgi:hypothetical protein